MVIGQLSQFYFGRFVTLASREVKLNFSFAAKNYFYFFPERSSHNKGLCKVKKIPKIPKKIGSGWVGPGLIWIKKNNWKIVQKQKFCVCTICSLLTACIVNAIVLHKQRSRKSTKPAMCVWRLSLAHTIWPNTNKKQDTRGNRQYGRVCLLTLRYSHIQMMDSILICRLIIDKSTSICTWYNVLVFCLDCMMWYACK